MPSRSSSALISWRLIFGKPETWVSCVFLDSGSFKDILFIDPSIFIDSSKAVSNRTLDWEFNRVEKSIFL